MNCDLLQLTYVSTATTAFSIPELEGLLARARQANRARGITGLLLYNGTRFLQILEGEESVVRAVIERIQKDKRHRGIGILSQKRVPARAFGEWNMAFVDVRTDTSASVDFAARVAALVREVPEHIARGFVAYAQHSRSGSGINS